MAQKQNNNWCFGNSIGVSFNTIPPSIFTPTISTNEGVATVSHKQTGDLIFYTTTSDVYNRNYNIMPNGAAVSNDNIGTCAQGLQVAPFVSDSNKYYLFTLDRSGPDYRLSYSVVDMTLDGGLGDVVAGQKRIAIDSGFSEAMVIIEGCSSYWVVVSKKSTGQFYAYGVTASGVSTTPVISNVSYTQRSLGIATMKVSPDRTTLGFASYHGNAGSFLAIHDFDKTSGQVTNGRVIDSWTGIEFYACEFSPNSKLLYAVGYTSRAVFQYDITLGTAGAIKASKKTVHVSSKTIGMIQLAPDSNIYTAVIANSGLGRISNANAIAPNCVYTPNAIPIATPGYTRLGLPQAVVHYVGKVDAGDKNTKRDTSICLKQAIVLRGRLNGAPYIWQDGSTADSFIVQQEGTYWVKSTDTCTFFTDTIVVTTKRDTITTITDTTICSDGNLLLQPSKEGVNATYLWSTGSTNKDVTITNGGKYWVATTEICDVTIDTFNVEQIKVEASIAPHDTTICRGDTIVLTGVATPGSAAIKWSTQETTNAIKVWVEGTYRFSASFKGCNTDNEVYVSYHKPSSVELGDDQEICSDELLILPFTAVSGHDDHYLWQDGSIGKNYKVTEAGVYHVTVSNSCQTLTDTIVITTRNCRFFFPTAFTPNGDGKNDIAKLLGDVIHVSDYRLRIFNRWGELVFYTNNAAEGWSGYYKKQKAEVGVYYYQIQFNHLGESKLMKGDIVLLR